MTIGIGIGPTFIRSASWAPTDIAGCILWLRADMGITLNGADVSGWADQSGNANDASQATASEQPLYEATGGPNSTPCVTFDRSNTEEMDLPVGMTDASDDYTLFVVCDQLSTGTDQSYLGSSGNRVVGAIRSGNVAIYDGSWRTGAAATTGEQYLTFVLDRNTSVEFYRNGVSLGTALYVNAWNWATPHIGEVGGGTTGYDLDAQVAEIILYNTALASGDLTRVHSYLAARYGL